MAADTCATIALKFAKCKELYIDDSENTPFLCSVKSINTKYTASHYISQIARPITSKIKFVPSTIWSTVASTCM